MNNTKYVNDLIKFNKEELIKFIEDLNISCHVDGILYELAPLYNSPYRKEFLIDAISEWYKQEEHTQNYRLK